MPLLLRCFFPNGKSCQQRVVNCQGRWHWSTNERTKQGTFFGGGGPEAWLQGNTAITSFKSSSLTWCQITRSWSLITAKNAIKSLLIVLPFHRIASFIVNKTFPRCFNPLRRSEWACPLEGGWRTSHFAEIWNTTEWRGTSHQRTIIRSLIWLEEQSRTSPHVGGKWSWFVLLHKSIDKPWKHVRCNRWVIFLQCKRIIHWNFEKNCLISTR